MMTVFGIGGAYGHLMRRAANSSISCGEPNSVGGIYWRILKRGAAMRTLLQRLSRWFHSFDEDQEPPTVIVRTPEDGARIGMVGWY